MNETIRVLTTRKSCRSFLPEHITKDEMRQIMEAGLNAPSGRNFQTQLLVAIQDDATVALLSKLNAAVMGVDSDPFYGAKDVIAVLVRKEGTYLYDGSLTMGNLLNAAWAIHVGSCWIHRGKEVFESQEGKALLAKWGIHDAVEGIGFCILGHTDTEKPKTDIRPNRAIYVG